MNVANSITVKAKNKRYDINVLNNCIVENLAKRIAHDGVVNIFASGPSIADVIFSEDTTNTPCIFMNGSISLTKAHNFKNIVAYVISDKRFIKHNPEVLTQFYKGQPLFATQAVYEAIALKLPDLIQRYHSFMHLIFQVNEPLQTNKHTHWSTSLPFIKKLVRQKQSLNEFVNQPNFIIKPNHKPTPIGVSLDITKGFVEAGTVAYVAAQLAYSLKASKINLYGIDLINSEQPRFYENKGDVATCKLDKAIVERIVPSFDLLAKSYRQNDVAVVNCSNVSQHLFNEL